MDPTLQKAYSDLESDIQGALRDHHGNASVISTAMNTLLLYPDRPFGLGALYGHSVNPDSGERERFPLPSHRISMRASCTQKSGVCWRR
jgi:hypothetical protein